MNRLKGHTQTQAAIKTGLGSTVATTIAAWLDQRWGWHLSMWEVVAAGGFLISALTSARFYIGERGILGAWQELLHGRTKAQ